MSTKAELAALVFKDKKINTECLDYVINEKDPLHVQRKQQQRAINNTMILIALFYGNKKRTYQDLAYMITDRSLRTTPYEKYICKLRGLTIIGNWIDDKFYLITSYWNFVIKQRKRY